MGRKSKKEIEEDKIGQKLFDDWMDRLGKHHAEQAAEKAEREARREARRERARKRHEEQPIQQAPKSNLQYKLQRLREALEQHEKPVVKKEPVKRKPSKKNILKARADLHDDNGKRRIETEMNVRKGLTHKEKKGLKASLMKAIERHIDGSGLYVDLNGNQTVSLIIHDMGKYINPEDTEMMKLLTKKTEAPPKIPITSGVINTHDYGHIEPFAGKGLRLHIKTHVTPNGRILVFDSSSDSSSSSSDSDTDTDEEHLHPYLRTIGHGITDIINDTKAGFNSVRRSLDKSAENAKRIKERRIKERQAQVSGGHFEKPHH